MYKDTILLEKELAMDDHVIQQVKARIKSLLFDQAITCYREHEIFCSQSNQPYHFLIWKIQPNNVDAYAAEVQALIEKHGYQFIPGACDVSTFNPDNRTGYKVLALYKNTYRDSY
jgi:hypothetical protein